MLMLLLLLCVLFPRRDLWPKHCRLPARCWFGPLSAGVGHVQWLCPRRHHRCDDALGLGRLLLFLRLLLWLLLLRLWLRCRTLWRCSLGYLLLLLLLVVMLWLLHAHIPRCTRPGNRRVDRRLELRRAAAVTCCRCCMFRRRRRRRHSATVSGGRLLPCTCAPALLLLALHLLLLAQEHRLAVPALLLEPRRALVRAPRCPPCRAAALEPRDALIVVVAPVECVARPQRVLPRCARQLAHQPRLARRVCERARCARALCLGLGWRCRPQHRERLSAAAAAPYCAPVQHALQRHLALCHHHRWGSVRAGAVWAVVAAAALVAPVRMLFLLLLWLLWCDLAPQLRFRRLSWCFWRCRCGHLVLLVRCCPRTARVLRSRCCSCSGLAGGACGCTTRLRCRQC